MLTGGIIIPSMSLPDPSGPTVMPSWLLHVSQSCAIRSTSSYVVATQYPPW